LSRAHWETVGKYGLVDSAGDVTTEEAPIEYYVDGGVLNNYPIDSFDGWWLSMEKEDGFFHKVVGEGGHKNYVERFGSYDAKTGARKVNPKTMGFRLAAANEPDAMHSRLGNDALELKVRGCVGATLPDTPLASKYSMHRYDQTNEATSRLKLEKDLRSAMTWIKSLQDNSLSAAETAVEVSLLPLEKYFEQAPPPKELMDMLGLTEGSFPDPFRALAELLRHYHFYRHGTNKADLTYAPRRHEVEAVLFSGSWSAKHVEQTIASEDLEDNSKLEVIQSLSRAAIKGTMPTLPEACRELEELLEARGENVMKRLVGMEPKVISSIGAFVARMIEAIQMTNDERVQTKENYSRTCMLNTEYVGTMDFKLDEGDHYFLWRKGFLTTMMWLDKRTAKSKDKKKKVAKQIAQELKKEVAKEGAGKESAAPESKVKATATAGCDDGAGKAAVATLTQGSIASDPTEKLRLQLEKVLANNVMPPEEKLDLIKRHLDKMAKS